jgi:glycosyltransferase involved in cell wall biosynthesis
MARTLAFIPAYNCERQIGRALAQFRDVPDGLLDEIIVVDNRSRDDTIAEAIRALEPLTIPRKRVLLNDQNYGLGGSHKVAFNWALAGGFDYCLVFHGDDQASVRDFVPLLASGVHHTCDCVLGARFMPGSRLVGYSAFRTFGNRVFNLLYSAAAGKRLYDLGSGLNLYRTQSLADRFYLRLGNDLTFNYGMILASCARELDMRFHPIEWREEDQRSNVKMIRQSLIVTQIVLRFLRGHRAFLKHDFTGGARKEYTWTCVHDSGVAKVELRA